jgi:shikimate dehydrogenase
LKQYGLIGYPLTHSFSQKYFREKFEREKIEGCEYFNFPLESMEQFPALLEQHPNLCGLNVTIPYKEKVMTYLHELDSSAKETGAVNCIKIEQGRLVGYNTDTYGFEMSIKPFLENKYERALILGTGGASKAVAYVLKKWNIAFHYATRTPSASNHLAYKDLNAGNIQHFPLIINTTPLGTFPNVDECPELPYEALTEKHFLYDLVYNPSETLFLKKGKTQGAHTMNGLKMLELQAEKGWQIWNS